MGTKSKIGLMGLKILAAGFLDSPRYRPWRASPMAESFSEANGD